MCNSPSLTCFHCNVASNIQDDYVVCPSCHPINEYDDCIEYSANHQKVSKCCCHIKYPNHPRKNTILLKKIKIRTKSGYCLKAKMTYPYMPLKKSIERIVRQKDILDKCEKWRSREASMPSFCLGMGMGMFGSHSVLIMFVTSKGLHIASY